MGDQTFVDEWIVFLRFQFENSINSPAPIGGENNQQNDSPRVWKHFPDVNEDTGNEVG